MKRLVFALVGALSLIPVLPTPSADAFANGQVTFVGHGWGHGRGMGQYGALGYAVDHGWDWQRILDHYYGGTSLSDMNPDTGIGVRLLERDGKDTIVTSASGFTAGGRHFGGGRAIKVHHNGNGNFTVEEAGGCGGPWGGGFGVSGEVKVRPDVPESAQGNNINNMLRVCGTNDQAYRGEIIVVNDGGTQRTVNALNIENYLRGVVPRESPSSWGSLGGGAGMHALRAQAVAARSYTISSPMYSYATTCDSTACHVYMGAFKNGEYLEGANSDAAVSDTRGKVRKGSNGAVARTEYSSSTGGWTAGGTFPPVPDDGDDYSGNPNHNWTANVAVTAVESAFGVGALQNIAVTRRNGLGDMGGRVTEVTITGADRSVTTNGADVRSKLGLKSDWFGVMNQPSGGVGGYWILGADGGIFSFGNAAFYGSMGGKALNAPVVGMSPTDSTSGYWLIASDGGIFSFGDASFYGSMGGQPLNKPMVAMAVRPGGGGYWTVASDGGVFSFGNAGFYGSMGGQPLNKPIVGITPTASGNGYWLVASDGGIFAYGDAQFRGSTGSIKLNKPIVGMTGKSDGTGYWMVASDGGIFAFDAGFYGSAADMRIGDVTAIAKTRSEGGYLMTTANGRVLTFGDAPNFGSMANAVPGYRGAIQGIATTRG